MISPPKKRRARYRFRYRLRPAPFVVWVQRFVLLGFFGVIVGGAAWAGWQGARWVTLKVSRAIAPRPTCDVLVLGGTPAGIAAALSAARSGASVVLVEEREHIGGDINYAMLNMFDVPFGNIKNRPPSGIFGEFYAKLGVAFDIERAQHLFDKALQAESKLRVLRKTSVKRLILEERRATGAILTSPNGAEETVLASAIVDATDDAEIAARAGAGYYLGRENANPDKRMQAAGLLFSVKEVDWNAVRAYVRHKKALSLRDLKRFKHGAAGSIDVKFENSRALLRLGGTSGNYAWERGDVIKDYKPRGENIEVLSLNFGRQDDGTVVLNTLNVVGVNGLDATSRQKAHDEASREIPFLVEYLRARMPGFQNATLHKIAPELYIRETRHIHGFYALKVADIKGDRAFYDRIARCSYPLDLHPYEKGDSNPFGPQRHDYSLPLRALVPRKIDGIFVASRSLSATYSAAGSARVIPITMAAGQAAGNAASLCAREEMTPHQLVENAAQISKLQNELRAAGMDIGDDLVFQAAKS
ncbi:MAG TPA: FAD-dependent oxidoreductase [Abditibacterium sp.]